MKSFKVYTRAIILNNKKEVLLLRKTSKQKYWAWKIMLPGWTLEFWEDIELTLLREIKEEVNLDAKSIRFIDTRKIIIWEEHWLWLYYFVEVNNINSLKNMEPEKHEFCWFVNILDLDDNFLHKDLIINFIYWNEIINHNFSNIFSNIEKHTMWNWLEKYIDIKMHHFLKENNFKNIKIRWVYDRKNGEISKYEKNDKLFNWKRPTAILEDETLIINCFPWQDYVEHYFYLINSYLKINDIKNINISYELPSEENIKKFFENLDFSILEWFDYIILWTIDKIWIFENYDYIKIWEDFQIKIWEINWKKVWLVWVEFSIWGDIWGEFIEELSKYKVKNVIYVWKVWWIKENFLPNEFLATWNISILDWKEIIWDNIFDKIEEKNLVHWTHITSKSIILEDKNWLEKNKNYDFVDPEIWQFAKYSLKNWINFSYIHIISNNLSKINEKENLSNERKTEIIEKRKKLFEQIWNIILKSL